MNTNNTAIPTYMAHIEIYTGEDLSKGDRVVALGKFAAYSATVDRVDGDLVWVVLDENLDGYPTPAKRSEVLPLEE